MLGMRRGRLEGGSTKARVRSRDPCEDMSGQMLAAKERGNRCMKSEKYEEAIVHYSQAIKLDPSNHSLFSNRSLAFLKIQQYYLSLEDANEVIKLKPDWAKGYFRKAEVQFQTYNYQEALSSYKIALTLQLNDPSLEDAVEKTKIALKKEKAADEQVPWIGAAIGIFVGALVVVADQVSTHEPLLANPVVMSLVTAAFAGIGFMIADWTRAHLKSQRSAMLSPPVNLYQDGGSESEMTEKKSRWPRTQLRQRMRRGKS